jgi:type I restriction enzyme M protein
VIVVEEDCEATGVPSRGEGLETTILTPLSAWYAQNPDRVATFETAMRTTLQFVIKPHHLWSTLYELARIESKALLHMVQTGFDVFSSESAVNSLHGLFSEVNLDSFKLGHNHEARNITLCSMITEMGAVLSEADHEPMSI